MGHKLAMFKDNDITDYIAILTTTVRYASLHMTGLYLQRL